MRYIATRNQALGFVVSIYLGMTTLATRSLLDEAAAVQRLLMNDELESARVQVARIVGRDTMNLDEAGVIRAALRLVSLVERWLATLNVEVPSHT